MSTVVNISALRVEQIMSTLVDISALRIKHILSTVVDISALRVNISRCTVGLLTSRHPRPLDLQVGNLFVFGLQQFVTFWLSSVEFSNHS